MISFELAAIDTCFQSSNPKVVQPPQWSHTIVMTGAMLELGKHPSGPGAGLRFCIHLQQPDELAGLLVLSFTLHFCICSRSIQICCFCFILFPLPTFQTVSAAFWCRDSTELDRFLPKGLRVAGVACRDVMRCVETNGVCDVLRQVLPPWASGMSWRHLRLPRRSERLAPWMVQGTKLKT